MPNRLSLRAKLSVMALLLACSGLSHSQGMAAAGDQQNVIAAQEFYGPLRIRDMGPIGFTRLHMLPDHAIAPYAGAFALELHLAHSNTFATGGKTLDVLKARGSRAALSDQDIEEIFSQPGNAYLFDAALSVYQLTAHYAFDDAWSTYASMPVYEFGGGSLDGVIESFHDTFGFADFGRSYLPRNRFLALLELDGERVVLDEPPKNSGVGDPVLGLRYFWQLDEREAITLEVVHKFATQDPASFMSTGSADSAIQVSWHKKMVENAWYVNLAAVMVGDSEPFPEKTRELVPSLNIAWEHRAFENTNLVIQLNVQQGLFSDGGNTELSETITQASIGLRHRAGEFVWSYGLTENLVNFNNTADLGFHIGFAWLPQ